jgi:hypothetical protein
MKLVPTLSYQFEPNTSYCYTCTTKRAWDELKEILSTSTIEVKDAPKDVLDELNSGPLTYTGVDGMTTKVAADPAAMRIDILTILYKNFQFPEAFAKVSFSGLDGFSIKPKSCVKVFRDADATLVILAGGDDELWLYKSNAMFFDFDAIITDAISCHTHGKQSYNFEVRVPDISFAELETMDYLLGPIQRTIWAIDQAETGVYFKLNNSGTTVQAFTHLGVSGYGGIPEQIDFTGPFTIFQRKKGEKNFYFATYINEDAKLYNSEVDESIITDRIQEIETKYFDGKTIYEKD